MLIRYLNNTEILTVHGADVVEVDHCGFIDLIWRKCNIKSDLELNISK